jgi:hypothetical protein
LYFIIIENRFQQKVGGTLSVIRFASESVTLTASLYKRSRHANDHGHAFRTQHSLYLAVNMFSPKDIKIEIPPISYMIEVN